MELGWWRSVSVKTDDLLSNRIIGTTREDDTERVWDPGQLGRHVWGHVSVEQTVEEPERLTQAKPSSKLFCILFQTYTSFSSWAFITDTLFLRVFDSHTVAPSCGSQHNKPKAANKTKKLFIRVKRWNNVGYALGQALGQACLLTDKSGPFARWGIWRLHSGTLLTSGQHYFGYAHFLCTECVLVV